MSRFSRATFGAHRYSLSLVAAAACWGTATIISKRAVEEIQPLTLLPIELAISVAVLTVAVRFAPNPTPTLVRRREHVALGIVNPGISYALSLAGLARISASSSVLLWALEPLLILVLARLVLHEPVRPIVLVLAAVALTGVTLVVFLPGATVDGVGFALTIAGVGACAVYTVASSKLVSDASALRVVLVQQVAALGLAAVLFAGSVLFGSPDGVSHVSTTAWLSAIGAGVLYYAVAFWFYVTGLQRVPASTAGVFINLVPMFGLLASFLLLGERLTGRQLVGAIVIIAAVFFVSINRRSRV